jgi:poly(hydroxyalkanoate) depolymerase family esterase
MRRRPLWIAVAAACVAVVGVAVVIAATSPAPGSSRSPLSPVSSPLSSGGPSPSLSLAPGGGARGYRHGSVTEHGDVYPFAVYVPSSLRAGSAAPLVVVLHGCATTADQMAAATQFGVLAERDRFIVLYPDVDGLDASSYGRCWKGIWAPDLEGRGVGDAGAIADMTHVVVRRWHADTGRVYAIGISAGGYETSILGAYYPDLYAAIGVHSGAPYLGAEPGCLPPGAATAATAGLAGDALTAMGSRARVMPVIVIHGDSDLSVPYRCGEQVIAQWLGADNVVLSRQGRPGVPGSAASVPGRPGSGRARVCGAVVCGWFGMCGRAAADGAWDGALLVGWFGRYGLGAVFRSAGA